MKAADLTAGDAGKALISIAADATLDATGDVILGNAAKSAGTITVAGSGDLTVGGDLGVGVAGTGDLEVNAGSLQVTGSITIAAAKNSTGDVTFANATLSTGTLTVGEAGAGTFSANTTADVTATAVVLGGTTGGAGTFNLDGTGSQVQAGQLIIGDDGTGALQVTNSAAFQVSGFATMGQGDGLSPQGATIEANASLDVAGPLDVGEAGNAGVTIDTGGQWRRHGRARRRAGRERHGLRHRHRHAGLGVRLWHAAGGGQRRHRRTRSVRRRAGGRGHRPGHGRDRRQRGRGGRRHAHLQRAPRCGPIFSTSAAISAGGRRRHAGHRQRGHGSSSPARCWPVAPSPWPAARSDADPLTVEGMVTARTLGGTIADAGQIGATGGTLQLTGFLAAAGGTLTVGTDAELWLAGGASGAVVAMEGATRSRIGDLATSTVTVAGFARAHHSTRRRDRDRVELHGRRADAVGGAWRGHAGRAGRLRSLERPCRQHRERRRRDAGGGVLCAGTRILTPAGEVPVGTLRPGDLVTAPARIGRCAGLAPAAPWSRRATATARLPS